MAGEVGSIGPTVTIPQGKKSGPTVLGTTVALGAGAGAGYLAASQFSMAGLGTGLAKDELVRIGNMTQAEKDAIPGLSNLKTQLEEAIKKGTKAFRNAKIKWAVVGALVLGGIYAGIKWLTGGKADKTEAAKTN
jgi:hypothetical protein